MSSHRVVLQTTVLFSLGLLTGCGDGQGSASPEGQLTGEQLGALVYADYCAGCHGVDGEGSAACLTLINPHINQQSDARLYAMISAGTGGEMPAFADSLSQEEIIAVIGHLRSIQPLEDE